MSPDTFEKRKARREQFLALKPDDRIRCFTHEPEAHLAHVMAVDVERGIGAARAWSPAKQRWYVIEITEAAFFVGRFWLDGTDLGLEHEPAP